MTFRYQSFSLYVKKTVEERQQVSRALCHFFNLSVELITDQPRADTNFLVIKDTKIHLQTKENVSKFTINK